MKQAEFFYRDAHAPKPNRPNHIGAAVVIEWAGKILLERRADSDTWAFIGGGLRTDETLEDCARREVLEETGITLTAQELTFVKLCDDPTRIAAYPDGNVLRIITVVYKAVLKEAPVLRVSEESHELRFFGKEELRGMAIARTHLAIVEDVAFGSLGGEI